MSHRIIRSLFESRLAGWAATKQLRAAYQNVALRPEPATGETYFRAFLLPGGTASNDLAGEHRLYTGVFQISIVSPAGNGSGAAERLAEELAALYPLNDRLMRDGLTVQVMSPLDPGPSVQGDTTFTVPCSFMYRADTF